MSRTSKSRWHSAQRFEQAYQQRKADDLQASLIQFVSGSIVRALQLRNWLAPFIEIKPSLKILEVGAGPHGSVYFLSEGDRFAIDPLALFYRRSFAGIQADSGVQIACAQGEALPFSPSSFDLVISENVLDHTLIPIKVIQEIHRVLRQDGALLLEVNVSRWPAQLFSWIHENFIAHFTVLNAFGPHPHCFSSRQILRLTSRNGFELLSMSTMPHISAARSLRHKMIRWLYKTHRLRVLAKKR